MSHFLDLYAQWQMWTIVARIKSADVQTKSPAVTGEARKKWLAIEVMVVTTNLVEASLP